MAPAGGNLNPGGGNQRTGPGWKAINLKNNKIINEKNINLLKNRVDSSGSRFIKHRLTTEHVLNLNLGSVN